MDTLSYSDRLSYRRRIASQNSNSAFREWREERGLSITDVAKTFRVPWQTAYYWDRGYNRLPAHAVRRLGELSDGGLAWAVKAIWSRNLEDRCPCGCNGEIVFPDRDSARDVYVKILCENCGKPSTRTLMGYHFRLCRRCEYKSPGLGSVELICGGCSPFRSEAPLEKRPHAPRCERTSWKRLGRLSHYARRNTALDLVNKTWRSKSCTARFNSTRGRQTLVRAYLKHAAEVFKDSPQRESKKYFYDVAGFYPHERVPKIERPNALRKLYKACITLSRDHKEGLKVFSPTTFQPGHETVVKKSRENSLSQSTGLFKHYAQPKFLAKPVRGFCLRCGQALVSDQRVKYHLTCYREVQKCVESGTEPTRRRGPRVAVKNLNTYWAYATLADLGESIGNIGKLFDAYPNAIEDGIKLLARVLAEPGFYNGKFHERVRRYRTLLQEHN